MAGSTNSVTAVMDHAVHTAYSDPGRYAALFGPLPIDPAALSTVARNVIVHYRASGHQLPESTRDEINSRWIERIIAADQTRHVPALNAPRAVGARVQGCCRDHTLFCVAALREHGVPARSRVGFAGYLVDGWHHDHVIVEAWIGGRWQRFDPEVHESLPHLPTPTDIQWDTAGGPGFITAAQAWSAHRNAELDAEVYGVDPTVPVIRGERFLFNEVICEVAHRFGDELLLWDVWGRMADPATSVTEADATWLDPVAALLLSADAGDLDAERSLLDRYRTDPGPHPGPAIMQASPFSGDLLPITLR